MQVFTDAARDRDADELEALTDLLAAASTLRDIGPDLRDAIAEALRRIDALTSADEERRQELAALGAKLNALLDRPEPAAVDIADHLARQDDRLAELHELVDRLHTVAVTARQPTAPVATEELRADVSLSLEVLAGITQRLDQLEGRIDELLTRPSDPRAPDLGPLIVAARDLRGDLAARLDAQHEALAERLDAQHRMLTEQLDAQQEAKAELVDAQPGHGELPVDEVVAAVAERTEAGLAGMLRLIDARLERLRLSQPADDGAHPLLDAIEALGTSLAEIAGKQDELATVLDGLREQGSEPADGNRGLEERLDRHVADLAHQLEAIADQLHATLAELERRQPLVTSDSLKRAAASVREAVSSRRR